jgi:hypothetical protein
MPKLQFTLFWCKDADVEKSRSMTIIWATREIAGRHGLELEFHPHEIRDPQFVLNYTGEVITKSEYNSGIQTMNDVANKRVRGLAHTAFPTGDGRLPIIFGKLADMTPSLFLGQTIMSLDTPGVKAKSDWLPWCVVDPFRTNDRPHAFLHEAGHAAGAVHNMEISAPPGDLMIDGDVAKPVTISASVLELLRRAYFYW